MDVGVLASDVEECRRPPPRRCESSHVWTLMTKVSDGGPPAEGTTPIKSFKSALTYLDLVPISSAAKFDARVSSVLSGINGVKGEKDLTGDKDFRIKV
ncbi:hypothetical protein SUGI_0064440 [Cryptomeria japonica]|nr:hypothetical protein SUGI_0064440 [Cryptomeria japonica]